MSEFVEKVIEFAPAVAALLWVVWSQARRLDTMTEHILDMARECDCEKDERS